MSSEVSEALRIHQSGAKAHYFIQKLIFQVTTIKGQTMKFLMIMVFIKQMVLSRRSNQRQALKADQQVFTKQP